MDNKLQVLLLLNSLSNSWKTLVVSPRNYALKDVLQLAMFNDSFFDKKKKFFLKIRRNDMGKDNAQTLDTKNSRRSKSS